MQSVKNMFGGGSKEEGKSTEHAHTTEHRDSGRDFKDAGMIDSKRVGDDVAVGLPEAGVGTATHAYTDTNIETREVEHAVSAVEQGVERGQDVGMKEELVRVPVTTMQKTTVDVPETVMEQFTVSKPVTVTREVPETVRDVEMKTEMVEREEVVIDKEMVQQPTTVMKPVVTEVPRVREEKVTINELTEELKRITVVRPRVATETVRVMRPVEVRKTVLVKRPVLVKKMVPVKAPVQVVDLVNVTQPQLSAYEMEVQVPHTEAKHVEYEKPVTVIKSAAGMVEAENKRDQRHLGEDSTRSTRHKEIPVGLPFTEMVAKAKNFDVTSLHTETAAVRQTVMQPVQVERFGYEMTNAEVEVTEVDWEEVEEEVVVSELQEFEDAIKVTILDEVEEEWPVARERAQEVLTSTVTLEPRSATVPEIGVKDVEVEVPRTVTKTEAIEKAVPVEREVMVEKAFTEHIEVPAERPVERMRQVEVEQPVVHYEEKLIQTPVTVDKDVVTSAVHDHHSGFKDQVAHSEKREVDYKVAQAKMQATAVPGDTKLDRDVEYAGVTDKELSRAKDRHLDMQPGVEAGAVVRDGHAYESGDRSLGKPDARAAAPDAVLSGRRGSRSSSSSSSEGRARRADVGTGGTLVDEKYKDSVAAEMAAGRGPVVEGGVPVGAHVGSERDRVVGSDREGLAASSGVAGEREGVSTTDSDRLQSEQYAGDDSVTSSEAKKKGLFGRMKDKMKTAM